MSKWQYTKGLHDLGNGCLAYLQPDGSWGWSNAGLVVDGDENLLVDTLFDLKLTREMLDEMRAKGLTDPLYTQTAASVRLTLFFSDALPVEVRESLPMGALKVLDLLRRASRPLGTGQIADAVGVTRPTASRNLQRLQDAGLVIWEGQSAKDPRAAWRLA